MSGTVSGVAATRVVPSLAYAAWPPARAMRTVGERRSIAVILPSRTSTSVSAAGPSTTTIASVPSIPALTRGLRISKCPRTELMKRISPSTTVSAYSACGDGGSRITVLLEAPVVVLALSKRNSTFASSPVTIRSP